MKKLLLLLILSALLLAKGHTATYQVEIVQDNSHKKGIVGKFATNVVVRVWKKAKHTIKEVFISISTNMAANDISQKLEAYMQEQTVLDIDAMNQHFNGQIRVALIEKFQPTQEQFKVMNPIYFDLQLRQDAYVYLISISPTDACLVFPNALDNHNYLGVNDHQLPANDRYQILSDRAEEEQFYLVSSLEMQFFKAFKAKSIYKCTSRNKGLNTIAELKNNHITDVATVSVSIIP